MEQLEAILERLWVSLEIDAQPGFKENSEVGPGTLEVRVSQLARPCWSLPPCLKRLSSWRLSWWWRKRFLSCYKTLEAFKRSRNFLFFFCFEVEFPASFQTLTENLVSDHFFFRTRLRLWRSLSLTGSDAAQAGGFEIGRAPCDWQAVTALPPCLDFHYLRVEIHVCQRLVCTWVHRFTLSPIKVTPVEDPIFHMGGRVTLRSIDTLALWPWSRFYFICHKTEKYLILYTLLSAWLDSLTKHCVCLALCKQQEATADTGQDVPASAGQVSTTQTMYGFRGCIAVGRLIFVKSVDAAYRLKILPAPEYGKVKVSNFLVKKKCCKSTWRSCNGFLEGFQISIFGFSWHIKSRQIWEHVFKSYMNFKLEAGAIQYQLAGP